MIDPTKLIADMKKKQAQLLAYKNALYQREGSGVSHAMAIAEGRLQQIEMDIRAVTAQASDAG